MYNVTRLAQGSVSLCQIRRPVPLICSALHKLSGGVFPALRAVPVGAHREAHPGAYSPSFTPPPGVL